MERRRASSNAAAASPSGDGLPFYRGPRRQMSSEIIAEARASLKRPSRPFTPLDTSRSLFGHGGTSSPSSNRPSSVYSIGSRQFEMGSSPDLTKPFRLDPIERQDSVELPRPPSTEPPRYKRRSRSASSLSREQSIDYASQEADDAEIVRPRPPDERPSRPARSAEANGATGAVRRKSSDHTASRTPSERSVDEEGQSQVQSGALDGAEGPVPPQARPSSGTRPAPAVRPDSSMEGDEGSAEWQEAEALLGALDPDEPSLDAMCDACDGLWAVVQRRRFAGRQRNAILRTMYRLMDSPDARLLIKLCRVVLKVTKGGTTLFNACKMLFKLSRVEANDAHFQDSDMIDLLVGIIANADKRASVDALVFCAGILKNLSNDETAQRLLVKAGCIDVVARILGAVNAKDADIVSGGDSVGHLLFQLTALLRNLAVNAGHRKFFISSRMIELLCPLLRAQARDADLVLNISRILSKLTMHAECRAAIGVIPDAIESLVLLLDEHSTNKSIVTRLCFVLGNLTANNDDNRIALHTKCNAMDRLMRLFAAYDAIDRIEDAGRTDGSNVSPSAPESRAGRGDIGDGHEEGNAAGESQGGKRAQYNETEDVLVKLVRVIANLAIHPDIGPAIAARKDIGLLIDMLARKDVIASEELVLNIVGTINNLSFYDSRENAITSRQMELCDVLIPLLLHDNMEAVVETARVFGNFSRRKEVRALLFNHRIDELMIVLLDHSSREVVFTVCGVLMNLMADAEHRSRLREGDGVQKLVDVLGHFGREDWMLAGMVCKTLYNYGASSANSVAAYGKKAYRELSSLLEEFLEEGAIADDSERRNGAWRDEFVPVAQRLLSTLRANFVELEPLPMTSHASVDTSDADF